MACPCFYPVARLPRAPGQKLPAPLGDQWSGTCQAAAEGEWLPGPDTLQQLCNFGYAREKCPRLPRESPDAVRFCVSRDQDGMVRIYWVVEKNYLPFAHGALEYSCAEGSFHTTHPDARIAQQAEAYVSSYLRRKAEPRRP